MIITLLEAKEWLRVYGDEEDDLIESLVEASILYLQNATGKETFVKNLTLAKRFCLYLVAYWYEDRDYVAHQARRVRSPIITAMMHQLQFGEE